MDDLKLLISRITVLKSCAMQCGSLYAFAYPLHVENAMVVKQYAHESHVSTLELKLLSAKNTVS